MLHCLDLLGVMVFAISGALEARKQRMDIFGACAVGFVVALGGGTVRDIILQHGPVFWVTDSTYVVLAILASAVTYFGAQVRDVPRRTLLIADAAGLAVVTTIGIGKALTAGVSPLIALLMGTFTGVVGGIGRDVLCNQVPLVLCEDVYATVCLTGGVLLLAFRAVHVPAAIAIPISILFMFAFRSLAIMFKLSLPAPFRSREK